MLQGFWFCLIVAQSSVPVAPVSVEATSLETDESAGFTTRIETERLSGADPSAAEILRQSTGTAVRSLGGPGDFSTASIRGSSSAQVGVYIDGAPLMPTSIGTVDLSTLWLLDLETVDVHRGFSPATLGPEGFLGSLVLRTKQKRGGLALVSVGSFSTRQVALRYADRAGRFLLSGSAMYFGKDGDFLYFDDKGTPLVPGDDETRPRTNNDQNAGSFHVEARDDHLTISLDYFTKVQGSPAPSSQLNRQARYAQHRPMLRVRYGDWFIHPRVRLDLNLSALGNVAYFTGLEKSLYVATTEQTTRELEIRTNNVLTWLALDWLSIQASINVGGTLFEATAPARLPQLRQRVLFGGALAFRGSWLSDRLQLDLSSRLDGLQEHGRSIPGVFGTAEQVVINTTRAWLQPTLGLRGVPVKGFAVAAHIGRRERVPNFYELFGSEGNVRGNPNLKPEQQWSFDVGASYTLQRFLFAEAIYSEARLEQTITLVYAGLELPRAENVGRAVIRSVELSARSQPLSFLQLAANYTFQHTENLSNPIVLGSPLPGRPPHQARAEVTFLIPAPVFARAMFDFQYIDGAYMDTTGVRKIPSRYLLGARLSIRPSNGPITIALDLRNLLDQRTASVLASAAGDRVTVQVVDFLGFPLPGRSVFVTLTYAFLEEGHRS